MWSRSLNDEQSFVSNLRKMNVWTTLQVQYRMAPEIREIVSMLSHKKTPLIDDDSIHTRVNFAEKLTSIFPAIRNSPVVCYDIDSQETQVRLCI